ncbi:MAG: hypothetical protein HRK26_04560 [Rickettsiaceae bacterium H1]|nr:hypothetical protein [Rickettsiaceae bacterium H1]
MLKKVCGDYVINYLLKDLASLAADKFLIGDLPDSYDFSIPKLNTEKSVNDLSFLAEIRKRTKAQNIILLPANSLYCKTYVFKRIDLLMKSNNAVIVKNKSHRITAFNCKKSYKTLNELLKQVEKVAQVTVDDDDFSVIENVGQLIQAENRMQNNLRRKAIDNGVLILDPKTVYLSFDAEIAPGVVIYPNVFIGTRVIIEKNSSVLSFSHIEGSHIKSGCVIGPFARVRDGTTIDEKSKIGNFVEIKNSQISYDVKIKHLSYIGDAKVGSGTNIGAGVVTCNYDGYKKHETVIDKNCFIGANSSLLSPLYIASDVKVGAGSTITESIEEKSTLAIARAKQVNKTAN